MSESERAKAQRALEQGAAPAPDAMVTAVSNSNIHSTGLVLAVVLTWMACNVSIGTANKAIFTIIGFKYPVFLTMCHMLASHTMSGIYLSLYDKDGKPPKTETIKRVWLLSVTFCL